MGDATADLGGLREDLEKLVLLEEVAERRQQLIEERLERAVASGIGVERIREELRLSRESMRRLLDEEPPELAERLGVSRETVDNLVEEVP